MDYIFIEQDPEARGYNQFCHEITFHLKAEREMELFEFLEEAIGKRGRVWRLKTRHNFNLFYREPSTLRFIKKSDAMRFKLSWDEDPAPEADVLGKWIQKLKLNSNYGAMRRSSMSAMAPTWTHAPITNATPGISPVSGKTLLNIKQVKSRLTSQTQKSSRYRMNPCDDVIIMDYESSPLGWYEKWFKNLEVTSWAHYEQALDLEIKDEERSKQAEVERESAPLQTGLFLPAPEGTTDGTV